MTLCFRLRLSDDEGPLQSSLYFRFAARPGPSQQPPKSTMNTSTEIEQKKAAALVRDFVVALRSDGLEWWAGRFQAIGTALEQGDVAQALHRNSATAMTGPGSLSDVFAKDEPAFNAAWGACSEALQALKAQSGAIANTAESGAS